MKFISFNSDIFKKKKIIKKSKNLLIALGGLILKINHKKILKIILTQKIINLILKCYQIRTIKKSVINFK